MNKLTAYLSRLPPAHLLTICLVLVTVIGIVDYETGSELNIAMLYLLPIFMITPAIRKRREAITD